MYSIGITPKASRQLRKIAKKDERGYQAISAAIPSLADWPEVADVKALKQHQHAYRLRVGRYRIFFDVDDTVRIIEVQEVKRRDDHTY